jgi:hypothetical protein
MSYWYYVTPLTNKDNVNNPLPLLIHDNEDDVASCFVEEDDNFPGYVKLSLAEVNCTNIIDDGQLFGLGLVMNEFAESGHVSYGMEYTASIV